MKIILPVILVAALAACGGSGGSGSGGGGGTQFPTGSAVGSLAIMGGSGAGGAGGGGGGLQVTSTGDVFVLDGIDVPDPPSHSFTTPELGANPRTVAADQSFGLDQVDLLLGDDGVNPATGLWVKPGVTATLLPLVQGENFTASFSDGVLVEGTLTSAFDPAGGRTSVVIDAAEMAVGPDGVIDLSGGPGASDVPGGNGGGLQVTIATPGGTFQNQGTIDLDGGPGSDGGVAGSFDVILQGGFSSSGSIHADGGEASTGLGGQGGAVVAACAQVSPGLRPGSGHVLGEPATVLRVLVGRAGNVQAAATSEQDVWVTGPTSAASGAGPASSTGGVVVLAACNGWLVASDRIDVSGRGAGAVGGVVWALSTADLWAIGSVDARGGSDSSTAPSTDGGPGGTVLLGVGAPEVAPPGLAAPTAALASGTAGTRLYFAADVDARGGDGLGGGAGGALVLAALVPAGSPAGEVRAGLPEIRATGAGGGSGGAGGVVEVKAEGGRADIGVPIALDGGPASEADASGGDGGHGTVTATSASTGSITAGGGASAEGPGGAGGTIEVGSTSGKSTVGGPLSVKAGTGSPDGSDGVVSLDGAEVPLTDGVFTP